MLLLLLSHDLVSLECNFEILCNAFLFNQKKTKFVEGEETDDGSTPPTMELIQSNYNLATNFSNCYSNSIAIDDNYWCME